MFPLPTYGSYHNADTCFFLGMTMPLAVTVCTYISSVHSNGVCGQTSVWGTFQLLLESICLFTYAAHQTSSSKNQAL